MKIKEKELIEKLADLSHDIWAHWMKYLFSQCRENENSGNFIIPKDLVSRWHRQMTTDYIDLSEKEKESDREQARKIILKDH